MKLKVLMDEKGITQTKLSLKSGVSQAQISRILSGTRKSPTLATLEKLAAALEISVKELISTDDDDTSANTVPA